MFFRARLIGRMIMILFLALNVAARYRLHYGCSPFYRPEAIQRRRAELHRRQAERFVRRAVEMKGVLIKLGQFLSARVDILPEEFTRELARLQDAVPPVDFGRIRGRIRRELGREPETVFSRLDAVPIAAASLGQVHEAVLHSGERVAVKVQYPGIREIVEMDLRAIRWTLATLSRWYPRVRWDVLYAEFDRVLHEEMDYIREGRNADRFRQNFADDDRILAPRVFWDYTTTCVLTLEFMEGIKITDLDRIEQSGVRLTDLARLLVEAYILQIFRHCFLHGDPHPGNLFVRPGPRLVFLDFGLMQPLTVEMREGIRITAGGIIERDIPRIVRGLTVLGFIARDGDHRPIEEAARFFIEKYRDVSPKSLRNLSLSDVTRDLERVFSVGSQIQIPNNFILVWRTAGILNGINSKLDPNINIVEIAKPYALSFIKEGERGFLTEMFSSGKEVLGALMALPKLLEEFLRTANRGTFKTRMSSEDVTGALDQIRRLLSRAILAGFSLAFWAASLYLDQSGLGAESRTARILSGLAALALVVTWIRRRKS